MEQIDNTSRKYQLDSSILQRYSKILNLRQNFWNTLYIKSFNMLSKNLPRIYTLKNNWQVLLSIWQFLKSTRKFSFWLDIQSIWKVTYRFEKYIVDFFDNSLMLEFSNRHPKLSFDFERNKRENCKWQYFCQLDKFSCHFRMLYTSQEMDLTPLQSRIHSFAKYFFPPNFSLVFWKRKIWREKIYSSKEWILLCKGVFSTRNWCKSDFKCSVAKFK